MAEIVISGRFPGCTVKSAASGIVSSLSSVEYDGTGVHVKLLCHSYLRLGLISLPCG